MSTIRACLRTAGLTLLTLLVLVPALLVVALAWPLAPISATLDRLALAALLGLQTLWARGVLVVIGVRLHVEGDAAFGRGASRGANEASGASGATLLVSNHLSYLDVPVIAALGPCRFVARADLAGWPIFGFLSKVVRVIFIERERRRDLLRVGDAISVTLRAGQAVVVFPEGTSSRGESVLPFHPGLLEPAARSGAPCRALAIHYETPEESRPPSGTICWWGDMTLPPHLWSLMTIARIDAHLAVSPRALRGDERKPLAAALHAEVTALFRPVRQTPLAAGSAAPTAWAEETEEASRT